MNHTTHRPFKFRFAPVVLAVSSVMSLSACGLTDIVAVPMPDVRFDSHSYVVQPGDTVESIASRYRLDPNRLASVNAVGDSSLRPSQILRLNRASSALAQQQVALRDGTPSSSSFVPDELLLDSSDSVAAQPVVIGVDTQGRNVEQLPLPSRVDDTRIVSDAPGQRPEGVETIIADVRAGEPTPTVQVSDAVTQNVNKTAVKNPAPRSAKGWNWPTVGKVVQEFDLAQVNRQGVGINAVPGADVQAAADGEVVYSGKDLASYGNLVILRHKDNYLSAYSKVDNIVVKENQKVKAGETIALLSSEATDAAELHFEIRHNGEPVDPAQYLPAL